MMNRIVRKSILLSKKHQCFIVTGVPPQHFLVKQRMLSSSTKSMSTATAAAVAYDDDDNDESSLSLQPIIISNHRPRLQALRNKLQSEQTKVTSTKDVISTWSSSSIKTTTTRKTSKQQEEKDKEQTLEELLAKLDTLPPLPSEQDMLVDKYQRQHTYLRISLTERCNLRCLYCMPPEGVPLQPSDKLLSKDEILQLGKHFIQGGVDKLRFTGGEPLLRHDLQEIIHGFHHDLGVSHIGMTTNGVTLSKKLPSLVDAGLTHVNISLDTLNADKFTTLTRRPAFNKVMDSIYKASDLLGNQEQPGRVKINCVVMKDCNDTELHDFVMLTKDLPVDVRFIEWMPFNDNGWNSNRFVSYQEMLNMLVEPLQLERISDGPNDTTKWWKLPSSSSQGRIGFITSMSNHFCSTCNRLRLTADGQIKVCLFGSSELSLRDALRMGVSTTQMDKLIHYALSKKHYKLGGHGSAQGIANANDNRPMTLIGG